MKLSRLSFILIGLLCSSISIANTQVVNSNSGCWYFGTSISKSYFNHKETQRIAQYPAEWIDKYKDVDQKNGLQAGAMAGYRFQMNSIPYISGIDIGIGLYEGIGYKTSGKIYVFEATDSSFKDSFKIKSYRAMLESRVELGYWNRFVPYVDFGLGVANNRIYNQVNTPLDGITISLLPYPDKSHAGLAYQAGLGLAYRLIHNMELAISYDHLYSGKIESGKIINMGGQRLIGHIQRKLITDNVSLSLRYYI